MSKHILCQRTAYLALSTLSTFASIPSVSSGQASDPRPCTSDRPILDPAAGGPLFCAPRVQVFADGNVKDVLGGTKANGVVTGALGLLYVGNRFEVSGLVNVLGTADTVKAQYGSTVLLPGIGGALNAASTTIRGRLQPWTSQDCAKKDNDFWCNFGYRIHADASTRRWAIAKVKGAPLAGQTDSTEKVTSTMNVPIWGIDAGVSYKVFSGSLTGSDKASRGVEMIFDFGYIRRAIQGDITSSDSVRVATRRQLLGSSHTSFEGYQVGITLAYDQVRSSFYYVRLNRRVDGLSGGQIVATVDLRAALASGLLIRD